jgi:hypothetical protein
MNKQVMKPIPVNQDEFSYAELLINRNRLFRVLATLEKKLYGYER